jgi:DNA (cytosine-5)-methyltransferase 1
MIIDCFAGGGGASMGIEMALGKKIDIAVNHDHEAIRMHKVNHPDTLHLEEDIFEVNLAEYVGGRHVDLMWASPDCTQFSKAKGGKPREQGIRMLPWAVYKHAKAILPDVIIMENVEEIQKWGPLDEHGKVIKEKQGEEYQKFIQSMESLGYTFDSRELIAADYGAPTTRKRWYGIFRRDGKPIVWPEPTNYRDKDPRWLRCGDYIDWSDLGVSIFDRGKPLAERTQKRIANGIRKYIVESEPYFVKDKQALAFLIQYHSEEKDGDSRGQTLNEPIKTLDTSNRYGLVTSFISILKEEFINGNLCSVTADPGKYEEIASFLIAYYGTSNGLSINNPLPTIVTKDRFGLVNVPLTIQGDRYAIADIFLRMLKPEELKVLQGFPSDYIIDHDQDGKRITHAEQVRRIGNAVVPVMAKAIVEANCSYLK